jgi:putative oxidoreductase
MKGVGLMQVGVSVCGSSGLKRMALIAEFIHLKLLVFPIHKEVEMEKVSVLIARVLLAHMFLLSGISKIGNYSGTQQYMESMGVAGELIIPVIILEIGAGLLLIAGWLTRWASLGLAAFAVLTAVIFHTNFADQTQMIMFMKNLTITGGLIMLAIHGAGEWSVDAKWTRTTKPRGEHKMEGRAEPT